MVVILVPGLWPKNLIVSSAAASASSIPPIFCRVVAAPVRMALAQPSGTAADPFGPGYSRIEYQRKSGAVIVVKRDGRVRYSRDRFAEFVTRQAA